MSRVYYFGCQSAQEAGHFLWKPWQPGCVPMRPHREERESIPWTNELDGGLQLPGQQVQGPCLIHHKDGWTSMAFWDRTGDKRGNSCSAIIVNAEKTFDEMVAALREHFPDVWKRVAAKFELTLAGED